VASIRARHDRRRPDIAGLNPEVYHHWYDQFIDAEPGMPAMPKPNEKARSL
jgi:hypothetical protein